MTARASRDTIRWMASMTTVVAVGAVSVAIREWPVAAIPRPAVSAAVAGATARPMAGAVQAPDVPRLVRATPGPRRRAVSQPAVRGPLAREHREPPPAAAVTAAVVALPDAPGSDVPLAAGALPIEPAFAPGLVGAEEAVVPLTPGIVPEAAEATSAAVAGGEGPVSRAFVVAGRGIATGLRVAGARLRAVF